MSSIDSQVAASADDCRWYSTYFGNTMAYHELGMLSGFATNIAVRFQGVTIPDGATIIAAYLSFYSVSYNGSPGSVSIYGEDAANPSAISSRADGEGRTKTMAYVTWALPLTPGWVNSSDISSVISELTGSNSYASGASMQFIIVGTSGSGSNQVNMRSYDYTGNTQGAKLHIEYTSGEAVTSLIIPSRRFNSQIVR